jgi:hypothetical protein
MFSTIHRGVFSTLILVALVTVAACKDDGRIQVYPVQGRVLVAGAPAGGARVVFYPQSDELKKPGMPVPEGMTDSQGAFKLRSYEPDDGAPAGDFKVSVIWFEPQKDGSIVDSPSAKDRLAGRYSNPQKSQLTAKVEKGGGEIPPFELQ